MSIKTGVDIVYIPKFENLMKNETFIKKVFHTSEHKNYKSESLAGIFAAKEAFFKALNKKPDWLKIEIKKEKSGRPFIIQNELEVEDIDLSISHDNDYAIAQVIIEII